VKKLTEKLVQLFPYLIAIAFSIKATREPDIWWQIRTGEWILENGQVPKTDMFSNSVAGTEWINIKWGFEVMAAWITKYFGPESIFILQIFVSLGIVFFLKRIFRLFNLTNLLSNTLVLFITLALVEYRLIGRPEMTTHFLFVVYLYILYHHFLSPKSKWIWALIPLQIFWTNMHEAYGLGIIVIGIFFAAAWADTLKHKTKKPMVLTSVLGLSILAILVNPRGIVMLLRPLNIFSQVQQNKFTTELANIVDPNYWQKESYIFIVFIGLILFLIWKKREKLHTVFNSFKWQCLGGLLLVAFVVLGLMAARNIIFFFLLFAPMLAIIVSDIKFFNKMNPMAVVLVGLLFYVTIVSDSYYRFTKSNNQYGLFVQSGFHPIGAANFIQQHGLTNKKCFSSYIISSYLLWKLQPNFKTYIDLRDLDVFSEEFFRAYFENAQVPEKFIELDKKEQFEYVVLFRKFSPQLHHYLYTDTVFGCIYADPVCAIYQKTDSLAQGDHFRSLQDVPSRGMARGISTFFYPLYEQPEFETYDVGLEAAEYYMSVGMITLAKQRLSNYLYNHPNDAAAIALQERLNTFTPKSEGF